MSSIKYSADYIREKIATKVAELQRQGVLNKDAVYLVMLNGGVWFASHVFDCMPDMPNEVYFLKGHSYNGKSRGEIVWDYFPKMDLQGREVVVFDDICDSGNTVRAIHAAIKKDVKRLTFFTLLQRAGSVLSDDITLHSCIFDESKDFFAGCGLDDNARLRMLPYVVVV